MTPICSILRPSFEDYRNDTLPTPQRRMLREHLSECAECRDLAAAQDPTMVFARPYAAEALPESETQRILANVRTAVAFAQTEKRLRRTSRRRFAGAAAAAAAFGALLLLAPGDRASVEGVAVTASAPTPASIDDLSVATATSLQPAALPVELEGASTTDATVYEWSPGADREEPRVVWIVDRGLDI
jgi:anti-sigma factor RsiW